MCTNNCKGSCGDDDGTANCFPAGCSPQGCYSSCSEHCRSICYSIGCYAGCNGLATSYFYFFITHNTSL